MKTLKILLFLSVFLISSCGIQKYSTIDIKPDKENVFVNRVPSSIVSTYDASLSESWSLTYSRCVQIKTAIDKEIDQRQKRQNNVGKVFSGIGGTSGFATAVYALAVTNPSTTVIGILGLFSGSTFATSFGFAKNDERAVFLTEKSKKLEVLKINAEDELTKLEELIAKKNMLVLSGKNDIKSKPTDPDADPAVIDYYNKIEDQIIILRKALSDWDNEAK